MGAGSEGAKTQVRYEAYEGSEVTWAHRSWRMETRVRGDGTQICPGHGYHERGKMGSERWGSATYGNRHDVSVSQGAFSRVRGEEGGGV